MASHSSVVAGVAPFSFRCRVDRSSFRPLLSSSCWTDQPFSTWASLTCSTRLCTATRVLCTQCTSQRCAHYPGIGTANVIDMSPRKEERAKGVILPEWWLEKVRSLVEERGTKYGELGRQLAEVADRDEVWDHSAVSRFLRNIVTTAPMAEAFAVLLGVPPAFYMARTMDEAFSLQSTAKRYDSELLTTDQTRRLRVLDTVAASELASTDQTKRVPSRNEGAGRGRRVGRTARGGSSSS